MSILTYLQSLSATHLFTFDNVGTLTTDDEGDSGTPTNISGGNYTFDTDPVCEGFDYSLDVVANTSSNTGGAVFTNQSDINSGSGWNTSSYSAFLWFKMAEIQNPTCVYEQGGGINNLAFMGGALSTWQAADAGEPFLIASGKSLTQAGRPYFVVGVWEHHSAHAGSGNRILFYINGIEQAIVEDTSTANFPSHTGDITCGNSSDSLKSFAETTQASQTTDKNINLLGLFAGITLTQAEAREIFERTTFADVTIAADTVANQQIALDALSGNSYANTNCAIRILQATDATNYRLFIDDITFTADPNLEDISVQFVGTGILTIEDTNGTVIQYTSTPPEVETTSSVITGGGSIVVVNNTIRYIANDTITNSTATKLVFDGVGTTYTVSGGTIAEFENVSGSTVTVNLANGAPVPTLTETSGTITLVQNVNAVAQNIIDDSRVQLYNVTKATEIDNSVVSGGSGYSYTINLLDGTVDDGDTMRLRATYSVTTTAKESIESTGVISSSGLTFLDTQVDDDTYNTNAVDGSAVTGFSADYVNDQMDVTVDADFNITSWYAWWVYNLTTSQGISDFFGGVTAEDIANYRINNATVDIYFDCTLAAGLLVKQIDNPRIYRADGAYPVIEPTSGGGTLDIVWREKVLIAANDDITAIRATVDANLDVVVSTRATQTSVDNLPSSVPSVAQIVDGVFDEIV